MYKRPAPRRRTTPAKAAEAAKPPAEPAEGGQAARRATVRRLSVGSQWPAGAS